MLEKKILNFKKFPSFKEYQVILHTFEIKDSFQMFLETCKFAMCALPQLLYMSARVFSWITTQIIFLIKVSN